MDQNFKIDREIPEQTLVRDDELGELIARLDQSDSFIESNFHHQHTVSEVMEATGADVDKVIESLFQLRSERLAMVLRELEEPLYSVERTTPDNSDPILGSSAFSRFRQRISALDDLPRTKFVIVTKLRRSEKDIEQEKASTRLSMVVTVGLLLVMLLAVLIPLLKRCRQSSIVKACPAHRKKTLRPPLTS